MAGLIEEGSEMTEEDFEGAVLDAGLIAPPNALSTTKSLVTVPPALLPKC
jgi:hypothetical protein